MENQLTNEMIRCGMDWTTIITVIITVIAGAATTIGLIYTFLRNFKTDINSHLEKMEKRIDILEERMFLLSTGKSLAQAILEEKLKKKEGE